MHDGIIASRYAKAFLEYTEGHGCSQAVTSQVSVLLSLLSRVEKLRKAVSSPVKVPLDTKMELLRSALAPSPLHEALERLYLLLEKHGRTELFRMVILDYLTQYRTKHGIRMVQVTTANVSDNIPELLGGIAEKAFGQKVVTVHRIDPSIVGGFIVDSWGYRLDASVKGALDKVQKQLREKNKKRIA